MFKTITKRILLGIILGIFSFNLVKAAGLWSSTKTTSPIGPDGAVELSAEFETRVSLGLVPGVTYVDKFGHNPIIQTTGGDIWSGLGVYDFYPVTAQVLEAVSLDPNDAGGDTGAWNLIVQGLSSTWSMQTVTVTLNGTTEVNLPGEWIRVFRASIIQAGSSEVNEGAVAVRVQGGGLVAAFITAGDGQTQQAIYTTPANTTSVFVKGYVAIDSQNKNGEVGEFQWKTRLNSVPNGAWAVKGQMTLVNIGSSWWQYLYGIPAGPIPGKTDIRILVDSASAIIGAEGGFDILTFDNEIWGL